MKAKQILTSIVGGGLMFFAAGPASAQLQQWAIDDCFGGDNLEPRVVIEGCSAILG